MQAMSYFLTDDYPALADQDANLQRAADKLAELHTVIYPRLRNHDFDLHPRWQKSSVVSQESAASLEPEPALVLAYFRSREQAEKVERLMGRDRFAQAGGVDPYRHPVIELRLTDEGFTVELVLSPYAWWDQRNFIGKLELPHHRRTFYDLLAQMDCDYRFGFWQGIHLDDQHVLTAELCRSAAFDAWIDTFSDRQDWLRIGKWYTLDAWELSHERIADTVFEDIRALNRLYSFLLWTGNNNFQSFYEKRQPLSRRMYA
jgi:hypothetical protein